MGNCLKGSSDPDYNSLIGTNAADDSQGTPDEFEELPSLPASVLASLGSGGNVYGIALGSSVADDSDAQARENEQMKLAKRMGLIHHLPQGTVDAGTNVRECVICMMDLIEGEKVRYLPCMHVYHTHCIDDWFQRSFTCPSCLEPVDAALLNTYNTT